MKEFSELNALNPEKRQYLLYFWSDKWFKGFVVNRTLPSLHIESIEITLTVPLRNFKIILRLTLDVVVMDLKIKTLPTQQWTKVLGMYLLPWNNQRNQKTQPKLLFPYTLATYCCSPSKYLNLRYIQGLLGVQSLQKIHKIWSFFLQPRHFANRT